ncbi:MAG: FIST N-terminal domain-containing protein [Devosia sp.]
MLASQAYWKDLSGWTDDSEQVLAADLLLYFGPREMLSADAHFAALRARFPNALIMGCSTGGQMADDDVSDQMLTALALDFADTPLRLVEADVRDPTLSRAAGAALGAQLAAPDLAGIFILSDGLHVNGSALVEGVASAIGPHVPVSGGLAGDGAAFAETLVACNAAPRSGVVAAIGFYGTAIQFGHGSAGGWDVFGPKRKITASDGNVLQSVDGKPALDLYKLYLGPEDSQKLPGSALLFPMRISDPRHPDQSVVRTVLAVDAEAGSMTFAGDMPKGWTAQLMRGSFGRLCAGAAEATHKAAAGLALAPHTDSAAILVSCIGRRLLMGQRIDEEIEAARAELPENCQPIGFYSYGEISPHEVSGRAQLHNQTMTVTLMSERAA